MAFDKPKSIGNAKGVNIKGTTAKKTFTRPQRPQLFNSKKRK